VVQAITPLLETDGVSVSEAKAVEPERVTLVVPAGAAEAVQAGKGVALTLHAGGKRQAGERSLRFKIQKAITRVYFAPPAAPRPRPPRRRGAAHDRRRRPGCARREVTAGFQRSVPSYLVMFVFLNCWYREPGSPRTARAAAARIAVAPVSRREIILGKLLGRFAIGWIQNCLHAGFGLLVGIRWAEHSWAFFGF